MEDLCALESREQKHKDLQELGRDHKWFFYPRGMGVHRESPLHFKKQQLLSSNRLLLPEIRKEALSTANTSDF